MYTSLNIPIISKNNNVVNIKYYCSILTVVFLKITYLEQSFKNITCVK